MKYPLLICMDPSVEVSADESRAEEWVEEMDRRRVRLEGYARRAAGRPAGEHDQDHQGDDQN
ncbi:hypothetical protein AB0F17_33355 [Nonomuraea sp. NPDC026600]|uniref:hypothetical protein n=1 Tax=Nonomuraea sp. NPDC026600 TaxID=3155363 RepID=UPI003402F985